jgi:hypothetical protein
MRKISDNFFEGTDNCEIHEKRARKSAFYFKGHPNRTSAIKGGRGGRRRMQLPTKFGERERGVSKSVT